MTNPVWVYDKVTGLISKDGVVKGCKDNNGYVVIWYNKKLIRAHRLAFLLQGLELPPQVDHINGIKDDNRWENLRGVTNMENQYNRRGNSKYGHMKGAYYDKKSKKWYSLIRKGGKRRYLGTFSSEEAAASAYKKASLELHGEYSIWKRHGSEQRAD